MICLSKEQVDKLVAHSRKDYPNETCGILGGKDNRVKKIYPLVNMESKDTFFANPKEQLKIFKQLKKEDLTILGIYHSHIDSIAYPSERDINLAFYPVSYMIISLKSQPDIKTFRISEGIVSKEELKIE